MKKCLALTRKNLREMWREPLSLVFCLGFPLLMLLIMQIIFQNMNLPTSEVPENFLIENYANGICVFGYTFTCLFIAMQIAVDKNTAFIKRLNIAPLSKFSYYGSYFLAAMVMAILQTLLFYVIAWICFGLPCTAQTGLGIIALLPSAVLYILIGLLIGCLCQNEKQTGPITSIFVTLTGLCGGIFMPSSAFRGGFATFLNLLPFGHSVQIAKDFGSHILYLLPYLAFFVVIIFIIEKVRACRK